MLMLGESASIVTFWWAPWNAETVLGTPIERHSTWLSAAESRWGQGFSFQGGLMTLQISEKDVEGIIACPTAGVRQL